MSGLNSDTLVPSEIKLQQKARLLEIAFEDGQRYTLTYEFLRVFTPSAEARGHGVGQEVLQVGKRDVDILRVEPVGNYAIKPVFSDGHESGLYSWDVLHTLCVHRDELWQAYLGKLADAGQSRDPADYPAAQVKKPAACGGDKPANQRH